MSENCNFLLQRHRALKKVGGAGRKLQFSDRHSNLSTEFQQTVANF